MSAAHHSDNKHLIAYQELHSAPSRTSNGGSRAKARYFLADGPRVVCWACLGEHESTTCVQKRCYRCAKPGHESAYCRSEDQCHYCNSTGHSEPSKCYWKVYQHGLDPRLHEEVQCLVCGQMGHINCSRPLRDQGANKRHRRS